ncbi:MAG TPA: PLDc N-terminal domain-containing protein [Micromonosporaceae bacterium]
MTPGFVGPVALLLVIATFEGYCLVDCARAEQVRYVNQWTWALIMLITMPLGGILYLVYGKVR